MEGGATPQRGYFHIKRSGGLAPNFASEIHVGTPNFASKNIGDRYPNICPLKFRYNRKCPQNCDSFQICVSCSNRTPQIFPLIWWTLLNLAPNFASKLDARSKSPDLLIWKFPLPLGATPANKTGTYRVKWNICLFWSILPWLLTNYSQITWPWSPNLKKIISPDFL